MSSLFNSTFGSLGTTADAGSFPSIVVRAADRYCELDAQRDVFESHRHHIFAVAYYMTGNELEAESILQSTFVSAFRIDPRPTVDELDSRLMRELHRHLSLTPQPAMPLPSGMLAPIGNFRRTDLEESLWQLPGRERLCFLLRDVEGYSIERIAGLLESSLLEVKRTLFSGRTRLRSLLAMQRKRTAA